MEESPMPTHLPADFNLKNCATIVVAAALWNKSSVRFFFDFKDGYLMDAYIHNMMKRTEKAFLCLPRQITNQILCTFKSMGLRIALWCDYAKHVMRIPKNVAATVHWTVYGTIDEGKIVRNWIDSKKFRLKNSKQMQAVYYAACSNVSIDFITLHWEKMLEFCNVHKLYPSSQPEYANKYIICSVMYLAKLESSQLHEAQIQYFNDFNYKEKRNMFMLSVEEGCPQAARYYWSLLSAADKKDLIIFAAMLSLDCYRERKDSDYFVDDDIFHDISTPAFNASLARNKSNCFADLLIFFIAQMSEDEISDFFEYLNQLFEPINKESIDAIFDVLICHWPLEDFLPLAYDVAFRSGEKPNDYIQPVKRLIEAMHRNKTLGLCNKQEFHQKLFKALWNKLRKHNTCEEILSSDRLLESIYVLFDLEVLNLIIDNCEDKYRKTIITSGKNTFKKLEEEKEFELLQKFINNVLQFEDEREWFRDTRLKYSNLLTNEMRFSELNEEQKQIRNQELAISLCERLVVENQVELAVAALKLIFSSEEEKPKYIKNFMVKKNSWVVSIGESRKTDFVDCVPKFILWLLHYEYKEIQIQKKKLISINSLKNLFSLLFFVFLMKDSEVFKMVDEFLLFCLSPKKIRSLKRNIRKKLPKWIEFIMVECVSDFVDDFFNWII